MPWLEPFALICLKTVPGGGVLSCSIWLARINQKDQVSGELNVDVDVVDFDTAPKASKGILIVIWWLKIWVCWPNANEES